MQILIRTTFTCFLEKSIYGIEPKFQKGTPWQKQCEEICVVWCCFAFFKNIQDVLRKNSCWSNFKNNTTFPLPTCFVFHTYGPGVTDDATMTTRKSLSDPTSKSTRPGTKYPMRSLSLRHTISNGHAIYNLDIHWSFLQCEGLPLRAMLSLGALSVGLGWSGKICPPSPPPPFLVSLSRTCSFHKWWWDVRHVIVLIIPMRIYVFFVPKGIIRGIMPKGVIRGLCLLVSSEDYAHRHNPSAYSHWQI